MHLLEQRLATLRVRAASNADALAVALVVALAYAWCLPPQVGFHDTGEAQTVPFIAGIFHPTGFPAYLIAGWLWSHAIGGSVAWRMNLFSALCTAGAAAVLVVTAKRLGAGRAEAVVAALFFASLTAVWRNATRAEPETFALLLMSFAILAMLAGRVAIGAACCGLALGAHTFTAWLVPWTLALGAWETRTNGRNVRRWGVAAAAFAAALLAYAYIPLRESYINAHGLDPTASLALQAHYPWNIDDPTTPARFLRYVMGTGFGAPKVLPQIVNPAHYGRFIAGFAGDLVREFGAVVALVVVGVFAQRERSRTIALLGAAAFSIYPFALSYGILQDPPKYFLVAYWIGGVLLARGITSEGASFRERFGREAAPVPLAAVAVLSAVNLVSGSFWQQRFESAPAALVWKVLDNTPDGALIAAGWHYATPLMYAAYVTHQMGHRTIVVDDDPASLAAFARRRKVYFVPTDGTATIPGTSATRVGKDGPYVYRLDLPPTRASRAPRP